MQISDAKTNAFLRLIRYGVSGAIGAVLQVGTLYVWVSLLGLTEYYLVGAILGFIIAVVCTYFLQRHWTFSDRAHGAVHFQLAKYAMIALANPILTAIFLPLAKFLFQYYDVVFFHVWYLVIQAGIVLVGALITFVVNSLWTFRRTE